MIMMKKIYLFLLLSFFCYCSNTKKPQTKVAQPQPAIASTQTKVAEQEPGSGIFKLYNDDFVDNILTIDVYSADTSMLKSIFKIKPSFKVLMEKVFDGNDCTFYVLETPGVYLNFFYKNPETYLILALIKADEIKLYKDCAIGMQKKDFCKILQIEETVRDTILVTNEDQTKSLYFNFKNNKLKDIKIQSNA